jgi:hypothetical protein
MRDGSTTITESSSSPFTSRTGTTVTWLARPVRSASPWATEAARSAAAMSGVRESGPMMATLPSPTASRSTSASAATRAGREEASTASISAGASPSRTESGGRRPGKATASTRLARARIDAGVR